ncbi:MAG: hypothetical protein J0L92_21660 [Deltaproteobacteria bacterium]|nr:hypothetical protein [Deltaproteobacteria bacterium]
MSLIAALMIGLLLGVVADRTKRDSGVGLRVDLAVGAAGAVAGALVVQLVDAVPLDRLSGWSVAFGLFASLSALVVYRSFAVPRKS